MVAGARRAVVAALLEAMRGRAAVVPAAIALEQVAAERARGADLGRRERGRRQGERGIGGGEPRIARQRRDADERTDPRSPLLVPLDRVEARQPAEVDHGAARDAASQPLLEVGAAGPVLARGGKRALDRRSRAHIETPASRRSGRIGSSRGRQPVALNTALPIDAATPMVESSPRPTPPPGTCSKPSSRKWISISGTSPMPGMR